MWPSPLRGRRPAVPLRGARKLHRARGPSAAAVPRGGGGGGIGAPVAARHAPSPRSGSDGPSSRALCPANKQILAGSGCLAWPCACAGPPPAPNLSQKPQSMHAFIRIHRRAKCTSTKLKSRCGAIRLLRFWPRPRTAPMTAPPRRSNTRRPDDRRHPAPRVGAAPALPGRGSAPQPHEEPGRRRLRFLIPAVRREPIKRIAREHAAAVEAGGDAEAVAEYAATARTAGSRTGRPHTPPQGLRGIRPRGGACGLCGQHGQGRRARAHGDAVRGVKGALGDGDGVQATRQQRARRAAGRFRRGS